MLEVKTIKIQITDLGDSYTPIISYCRDLIKKGEPEDCILEIYRNKDEYDVRIPHIGNLAKLSLHDMEFEIDHKYIKNMPRNMPPRPVH